jgi:hypothetical protein
MPRATGAVVCVAWTGRVAVRMAMMRIGGLAGVDSPRVAYEDEGVRGGVRIRLLLFLLLLFPE